MYNFQPIGFVESVFKTKNGIPRQSGVCSQSRASLRISKNMFNNPEHSLEGLEQFSHVWVIFVFHKNNNQYTKAKVRPPRLNGKKVGLFSTRCPYRPNPVGLSLVKLDNIKGDTLYLSGIDLLDGTPVLDIKPFIPDYDQPFIGTTEFSAPDFYQPQSSMTVSLLSECDQPQASTTGSLLSKYDQSQANRTMSLSSENDQSNASSRVMSEDTPQGSSSLPFNIESSFIDHGSACSNLLRSSCHNINTCCEPSDFQNKIPEFTNNEGNKGEIYDLGNHMFLIPTGEPDSVRLEDTSHNTTMVNKPGEKSSSSISSSIGIVENFDTIRQKENADTRDIAYTNSDMRFPADLKDQTMVKNNVKIASWLSSPPIAKLSTVFTLQAKTQLQKFGNTKIKSQMKDTNEEYKLNYMNDYTELSTAIVNILENDPRSTYRRTKCRHKLYYFSVDAAHVTCWFYDDTNTVYVVKLKPVMRC